MGDHLAFERYQWFDRQIRQNRYPNAITLAAAFEISERTARRNIDYMRTMLGAPLEYDPRKRGFRYADHSFTLPQCRISQEEMLAVLLARNLLSCCAEGLISTALGKMVQKLLRGAEPLGLSEERLEQGFSAVWHGYSPAQAEIFRSVSQALLANRRLLFTYSSPIGPQSSRCVDPHHLQHYMGNWMLLAWCCERRDWRKFHLARMTEIAVGDTTFDPRPREEWAHHLDGAFGIFQGREKTEIRLRFTAERARWIREQFYHPDQCLEQEADGRLLLSLPVADFREIKLLILQFGADVEVLAPPELREQIKEEIGRMGALYG